MAWAPIVAAGAQMVGSGISAFGAADAANEEAGRLKTAATYARAKADETDTRLREEMMSTLGTLRAARAAAGVSMDSPTQDAVEGRERTYAERNIKTMRANQEADAREAERASEAKRRSARMSLVSGAFDAVGAGLKTYSGLRK